MTKIINVDGSLLRIEKINKQIELSQDQTNALNSIKEWLYRDIKQPSDCFFKLLGGAGTGKTTLIANVISDLQGQFKFKTCISAPTHKAKKVIVDKTGFKTSETVQALLGLKPDIDIENFDVNNPIFNAISQKKLASYRLLIIDESSMINNDLYSILCEDANRFGTKILFIGDTLQLPPVNEKLSQSLISPVNGYELTEIIRQKNTNPLLEILGILRDDIVNNTINYIQYLKDNPTNINEIEGYKVLSGAEFGQELIAAYKSMEYQKDRNYLRYISWTNKSIQDANRYIRKHSVDSTNPLVIGELLLGYKTITDNDNDLILLNSEDYIVDKIEEGVDGLEIKVLYVTIKGLDDNTFKKTIKIVSPNFDNYMKYLAERDDLLFTAKQKKGKFWRYYFDFRGSYVLLENLLSKDGKTLLDKKDIDYGYGVTIHKSQGSTYNTIFVDAKNINLNRDETDKKKLLYVALSRASNKVYINL
jgi:exodeoxyribonuclease-5